MASISIAALSILPPAAQALPDQRAYEQVSPVDKNGANVYGTVDLVHASPSGNRLVYFGSGAFPGSEGAQGLPQYLSTRDGGSWYTIGLLPRSVAPASFQTAVVGWSADLTRTLVSTNSLTSPDTYGLFAHDSQSGDLSQIAAGNNSGDSYAFDAATADARTFLFEDSAATPLVTGGAAGADNVYQWSASGGLSLVGVLPDGSTPPDGSFAGPYRWTSADAGIGGALEHLYTEHVISNDGSRAFFTAAGTGQIYVRENGTTTEAVSASQKANGSGPRGTDPNGPQPAAWMASTPDGSSVFFTSPEELTNDANTGSADQGNDLYRYDVGTGQLLDLTADGNPSDTGGASVRGVLGVSDNGSYVYFVALGALTDGAVSGQPNLYLWHNGTTTFVASLSAAQHPGQVDAMNWEPGASAGIEKSSRVTPDGQTLLFASERSLTGYDNQGHTELYRYSASDAELGCVSCDPSGSPAGGDAFLQGPPLPVTLPPAHQSALTHNLSDDGDRVFFVSPDALVPQDTNGQPDVYEWEASGSGSCQDLAGCLFLISTGQSSDPSYFADAGASGDDVFFFTSQPLVGQDQDHEIDVYDARVGGGIAAQSRPPATPCVGEVCKPPLAPIPPFQEPGTSIYSGPGNQTPLHATRRTHHEKHRHRGRHRHAAAKGGRSR